MQDSIRQLKKAIDSSIRDPGARLLQKVGIKSPNALTLTGVALTALFAIVLNIAHIPWLAFVILLSAVLTDFFDGPLARLQSEGSRDEKFGAWLDTVADRFNEALALGAFVTHFTSKEELLITTAAFVAGFLVTYTKAAAGEKGLVVNWDDRALFGYPGRVIIIMVGLVLASVLAAPAETTLLSTMHALLAFNTAVLLYRIWKVLRRPKA